MRFSLKTLLTLAGSAAAIAGIIYVSILLVKYSRELDLDAIAQSTWQLIILLTIVHSCSNVLLAAGWKQCLAYLGINPTFKWITRTYLVSQIAKYVPGNIFHLAGRQVLSQAKNYSAKQIAKSILIELGLLLCAGVLFIPLPLSYFFNISFPVGLLLTTGVAAFVLITIYLIFNIRILLATLSFTLFLFISGLSFFFILQSLGLQFDSPYLIATAIASFVGAWLIGFLSPGSPAGIGVREIALVFLLGSVIPEPTLLLAIVLCRVVSAAGDLTSFIVATFSPAQA